MDKIKKQELADKKANKNKLNFDSEESEKIDGFGNKIVVEKKFSGDIEKGELKKMQKEYKEMKKLQSKGESIDEDRFFELEEKIKIAEEYLEKEKLAKKAAKGK